jgi:hypothetical protein
VQTPLGGEEDGRMADRVVVAKVFTEPDQVEARLRELGLTSEIVTRAVECGDAEASMCTANDPVTISGSVRWGRSVRSLRDDLIPLGWTKNDEDGFPTVVHPKRRLAIAVVRGDEGTGIAEEAPKTKYQRGPASQSRVQYNAQLWLLDVPQYVRPPSGMPTYFLLVNPESDYVAFELSVPSAFDETGRGTAYVERIIFPRFERNPSPKGRVEDPLSVDVQVKRR